MHLKTIKLKIQIVFGGIINLQYFYEFGSILYIFLNHLYLLCKHLN